MPLMTTFEHAVLTAQDFVYAADFDWLIEQNFIGFAVQRSRGTWQLVVGHYLGVIQLPSGMLLEVLPKIAQFSEVNLGETRAWVKTMLATIWPGLNPKQLPVIAPQTRLTMPKKVSQCGLVNVFISGLTSISPISTTKPPSKTNRIFKVSYY